MDLNKQLNPIQQPILEGHNNNFLFRDLGLLHPIFKYLKYSLDVNHLQKVSGLRVFSPNFYGKNPYAFNDLISFGTRYFQREKIQNFLINFFSKENDKIFKGLPYLYIIYDIQYRNMKFNKEKNFIYKFKYSTDLALYHSMATLYFPYIAYKYANGAFYFVANSMKRNTLFMNFLGLFVGFCLFFKIVRLGDITSDFVMNNTYRKFIFDYRNGQRIISFDEEFEKVKELEIRYNNKN